MLLHYYYNRQQQKGFSDPSDALEGQYPSLWLRADQGVYTGGARQFYVADKGSLDLTGAGFNLFANADFTITGWFYADAVNVEQTIVADYHSHLTTKRWKLWISATGNLTFTAGTSTTLNAGAVTAGTWYFFAARIETSTGNMYVSVNDAAETSNVTGFSTSGDGTLSRFSIGSTIDAVNTLWFGGKVAKVAVFSDTLTSAERTYLYNDGNGRAYGELGVAGTDGSALTDSRLVAYYNLNEVAGTSTALDAHSTNDLTPTFAELLTNTGFETVTQTYGARQYTAASSMYHAGTDNATLEIGDNDAWFAGWVYLDDVTGAHVLFSKDDGSSQREYMLYTSSTTLYFMVSADGSAVAQASVGSIAADTWYFVFAYHDAVNDTINISTNGSGFTSTAHAGGIFTGTSAFLVGANTPAVPANFMDGRLTRLAIGKSPGAGIDSLKTTIRDALYNSGKGVLYAGLSTSQKTDWGLVEYWDGNETTSADLTGDHAAITLTNTNSVGVADDMGPQADFGTWSESLTGGSTINDETSAPDAGTHALRMDIPSAGGTANASQTILTVGHRYVATGRVKISNASGSNEGRFEFGSSANYGLDLTTSYATYNSGNITCAGNGVFAILNVGGDSYGKSLYWDTVSVKAVDIPAADGPESEIAADSIGSVHGVLTSFADPDTAWSSDQPTPIAALVDGSLDFDGTNDYVTTATTSLIQNQSKTSISGWFYADSVAAVQTPFVKWTSTTSRIGTEIDGTGQPFFLLGNSANSYGFAPAISAEAWYHIVLTFDGSQTGNANRAKMYINGVLQTLNFDGTTIPATTANTTAAITMGAENSAKYFNGKLCDWRVYDGVTLSQSQVSELYAGSEATGATPTARWKLDDGPQSGIADGDPVIKWTSIEGGYHDFEQATASKRPLYVASAINSKPGIDFDGTDDLLVKASAFLTGTSGTVIIVYRLDAVPNSYQTILASGDEATSVKYLRFIARGSTANPHINYQQASTSDLLDGDTTVNVDTNYVMVFASDGSTITARLNGTAQTLNADAGANNGNWWSDEADKDNVALGGLKIDSELQFLNGKIAEIIIYPINLSAASIAKVSAYTTARYSVGA